MQGKTKQSERKIYRTMNIGLKIKQLCERDNISLAELARRLGRTRPAIYEMVEKEDVNTSILRECSSIFNIPISYFFEEEDVCCIAEIQEKLSKAEKEIESLRKENLSLRSDKGNSTRVIVELDVTPDEFIKMGLKDKVIQILNK